MPGRGNGTKFTDGPRCGEPKVRNGGPCQQPRARDGGPCPAHRDDDAQDGEQVTIPAFRKGNALSLKTGHRSARVYAPIAQELACGLLDDQPWLEDYPEAVAAWAEAEARAMLLRQQAAEVGLIDPRTGEPREGLAKWLRHLESDAEKRRERLGLDPRSDVALQRERAQVAAIATDLSGLLERGRAALERGGPGGAEVLAVTRE